MGHGHDHAGAASRRALAGALALTASYTVVELVGGVLSGSLALLADAVHMLSDNVALAVALVAAWLATKPATPERSYGLKRAEVLAALANGVMLVALAIWIFVEAVMRLRDPGDVLGGWMLAIALVGMAVNVGAGLILARARRHSLNVEAAFRHVFADLLGSFGVAIAAVVIIVTGWVEADPLVSILIGLLVVASAWSILRDSTEILLESTPRGIDADALGRRLASAPGVVEVHDLHVWTITSGFPALSAHVLVRPGEDCHGRRRELERLLHDEFEIEHTTLQVDHASEVGLVELERFSLESSGRAQREDARAPTGAHPSGVSTSRTPPSAATSNHSDAASVTRAYAVVPDELRRAGLEEAMRDDHLGADELALPRDRLDHERACVEDELEVELVDLRARLAPARARPRARCRRARGSPRSTRRCSSRLPARVVPLRAHGVREHSVALELREREGRDELSHDPVEQARDHHVRLGDRAVREGVVAVRVGHRLQERRCSR